MKQMRIKKALMMLTLLIGLTTTAFSQIQPTDVRMVKSGDKMHVSANLLLDSLKLKSNSQIFLTPVLSGEQGETIVLPTVLVTGRGMHYAYERGTMRGLGEYRKKYDILKEITRTNGKPQSIDYIATTAVEPWMRKGKVILQFRYDNCGCGVLNGTEFGEPLDTTFNPSRLMRTVFVTPKVTSAPVSIHEGVARVQFEVNRMELHDSIYICRNRQKIDNREQLKVIYDSIAYALTDPNVEISKIEITGYASPESPYEHNSTLATGRSKALADYIDDYIGKKYELNRGLTSYSAVPENWAEFRQMVVSSKELTETQRTDLLDLIDRPAFTAKDFDQKERELKTEARFRDLYRTKILPEWFPQLRATKFRISTRLRPMSDERLAEIILISPEKMSLNQMMRVANLYSPGTPDFMRAINTALKYYPDSEEANLNAAVAAISRGNFESAEALLQKAGDLPEAQNARAILMVENGDQEGAARILRSISDLPAARENLKLLDN